MAQEIERSIFDIESGEVDQITLGPLDVHTSGLYTQILHLLAEEPVAELTKASLDRSSHSKLARVMSAERPLLHRQLRDTMLLETMEMICFALPSRYCAALAQKCADGDGFSFVASAEYVCTLPEPLKGLVELNSAYNTSSFQDLLFTSSSNAPDKAVWLSENRTTRWRAALHILSKKLRPSPSAILYLHGVVARQMLDIGFYEVFVTRDSFSDMLILNILCLQRGGVEAFMRWTSTTDGLNEFIEDFQDVRTSVLMCHREMLVHHNEAKAFSYALCDGMPHF